MNSGWVERAATARERRPLVCDFSATTARQGRAGVYKGGAEQCAARSLRPPEQTSPIASEFLPWLRAAPICFVWGPELCTAAPPLLNKRALATGTRDALLAARLAVEQRQIARMQAGLAKRLFVLPWLATPPVGVAERAPRVSPEQPARAD